MNDKKWMEEVEWCAKLMDLVQYEMDNRKNEDYVINEPQMSKFEEAVAFFQKIAETVGGRIDEIKLTPKEENGYLTGYFIVFDLAGEEVQEFARVMSYCSAISMDAMDTDDVCISCTIPDVFINKSKQHV